MGVIRHGDRAYGQTTETSASRGLLVTVERSRRISASNSHVFAALSDPKALADLLPRVRKVEVMQRGESSARVATHMAVGPFATIRSEGEVRWQQDQEVVFSSRQPIMVETRWLFVPQGRHTDLQVSLTIDLSPMLGPLAAMVPRDQVEGMIAPDLEQALASLARRFERA